MVRSGDFRDLDILVVDDEIFFREDARNILWNLGCKHVRLADRGIRALTEVCHQHPDFILLDVIMPGMDGLTASTIIRDYEAGVGCRAFMVGLSNGRVDWRDYCIEAGMDVSLRKPVCRWNLEQLLGNLAVDSATSGSHLSEKLPLRTADYNRPMTIPPMQRQLRIIYAEDSPAEQEFLTRHLSDRGHDVVCCDDGKAALQAIAENTFDVLITDNDMPRMNGLALVQELRRLRSPIKIVVISGYLESEVETTYRDLGVERFLSKPSPDEKLFRAVESD